LSVLETWDKAWNHQSAAGRGRCASHEQHLPKEQNELKNAHPRGEQEQLGFYAATTAAKGKNWTELDRSELMV